MLKSIVSTFQTAIRLPLTSVLSAQQAIEILHQWQTAKPNALIFDSDRRGITQFLEAMDIIQRSPNTTRLNDLISKSMARLISEFRTVLIRQSPITNLQQTTAPTTTTATSTTAYWSTVTDSTGYTIRFEDFRACEPLRDDVVAYLRTVAGKLSSSGKIGDCVGVYKSVREPFLRSQLLRFDEVRVGNKQVLGRSNWDELIVKVKIWMEVSKICFKTLFVKEKEICEQIFKGIAGEDGAVDNCFVETVENIAFNLFVLVDSMSSSNLSYDKIGDVLGLYDAFHLVLPDIETLFACDSGKMIRDKCREISSKIGNDVVRLLYDFEKDVLLEIPPHSPDERGSIHQTTILVMKKISEIAKYKQLLSSLIDSTPKLEFDDLTVNPHETLQDYTYLSFLERHLILIIECLKINLNKKAKSSRDTSLAQLFLMNNVRYIVQKIESSSELQEMIGDSYKKVLNENVKSAMDSYKESTCKRFLTCFEDKGLYITRCFRHLISSRTVLRRRLKAFNNAFEEVRSLHSSWIITDPDIRNEIRVSMSKRLVPAYKNFLAKFTSTDKMKRLLKEKKIAHSAEDFEALILRDLFAKSEVDAS